MRRHLASPILPGLLGLALLTGCSEHPVHPSGDIHTTLTRTLTDGGSYKIVWPDQISVHPDLSGDLVLYREGGATGAMAVGPGHVINEGAGSFHVANTEPDDKVQLRTYRFAGVPLDDLTLLEYFAYVTEHRIDEAAAIEIGLDNLTGTPSSATLVWEPADAYLTTIVKGVWQEWRALNPALGDPGPGWRIPALDFSRATLQEVMAAHPNATIDWIGLGTMREGRLTRWSDPFSGAIDLLSVNVALPVGYSGITYDLEPGPPPVVTDVEAAPNPVPTGGSLVLTAAVSDATTGGSEITSAEYSLDGGTWTAMDAVDGAFDEITEDVTFTFVPGFAPGLYDICVRGADVTGLVSDGECVELVVYEPVDGFVTGGGWIASPPGAYATDPSLTGKVSFGFVARQRPGTNLLEGNTRISFQAAGLRFHSSSYEELLVDPESGIAQIVGTGTIHGLTGVYRFMLQTKDHADGDTFGVRIWEKDDGTNVIYDNGGAQRIDGGSIIVHEGGGT